METTTGFTNPETSILNYRLTGIKSSLLNNPLERIVDQLVVHMKPQVPINGWSHFQNSASSCRDRAVSSQNQEAKTRARERNG